MKNQHPSIGNLDKDSIITFLKDEKQNQEMMYNSYIKLIHNTYTIALPFLMAVITYEISNLDKLIAVDLENGTFAGVALCFTPLVLLFIIGTFQTISTQGYITSLSVRVYERVLNEFIDIPIHFKHNSGFSVIQSVNGFTGFSLDTQNSNKISKSVAALFVVSVIVSASVWIGGVFQKLFSLEIGIIAGIVYCVLISTTLLKLRRGFSKGKAKIKDNMKIAENKLRLDLGLKTYIDSDQ